MNSCEIERGDGEEICEAESGAGGEWVGCVVCDSETESLVTGCDHVVGVERFDVFGCGAGPVGDNGCSASGAAGFVGEFPCEYGGVGLIPRDNGGDVFLVLGLCCGVGVPVGDGADAVVGGVGLHSAIVSPVVDEVDDQTDAVGLSGLDNVIEALKTVGSGVDYGLLAGDEGLEPDGVGVWCGCNVVETPHSQDFETRLDSVQIWHISRTKLGLTAARWDMTRSTSELEVRNPIQYELVPAKYVFFPLIWNTDPAALA
jgi:hypothetical protein